MICTRRVSKGSEALPPVADKGKVQEANGKEQCKRRRSNATIEQAGLTGKPFGRARRREFLRTRVKAALEI